LAAVPSAGLAQQVASQPHPAASPTLLLNSNENALGLSPAAREAVIDAIAVANRYPDARRTQLIEALAVKDGVAPENIVLGNGSTEILQIIVQAATSPNATLVVAEPTFEAVPWYQRPFSYRLERVSLDAQHGHDLEKMRDKVRSRRRPAVVYLCNPNNPTGTLTASADIDSWIEEAPETTLFAVDEAYFEYVRAPGYWSAVKWIRERPNVVVARTFSKIYGMAGLRLGYAVTHRDTAERLREFSAWDNANVMALEAGLASLTDRELVARSRAANEAAKKITQDCLQELGLEFLPSHANFLMHRIRGDLETYIRRMREHGIRVGRPFPPMLSYNRLSLGTPDEMGRWASVLRDFRSKGWV
jgi:histidinol-phosphate aminotransferase